VTGASGLRIAFQMKPFVEVVDGNDVDKRGDGFEAPLLDLFQAGVPGIELTFAVSRSFADEFGAALNGDIVKLEIALILILCYAALMLSRWDQGCVGSRVSLTFSGIFSIGREVPMMPAFLLAL
jgi:hypothetical protein